MWTIGREREKLHAGKYVRQSAQQQLLFPVIDAVHDLKEGKAGLEEFCESARTAMTLGGDRVWEQAASWVGQVEREYPEVASLWNELALNSDWRVRWRVAYSLYCFISEPQSDQLFAKLRHDRSKKVREFAVQHYEYRPDASRTIVKQFDASLFVPPEGNPD